VFCSSNVFKKNEFGDNVAIAGWRRVRDCTLFLEPARNPVQCFVGQFIGRKAILAVKVTDKSAANLEILLALGGPVFIKPVEQTVKGALTKSPILLSPYL
jgi:hypothetical protein